MPQKGQQALAMFMLAALLAGCGRSSEQQTQENPVAARSASFRDGSPQHYLAAVFSRYRSAASYHDRGIVRLGYTVDGRRQSKTAPMRVWFDHDRLHVAAYDVKISSDAHRLTAWINDPETRDFDSQVLRLGAIGRRPTLDALLPDPILATRVSGGLAGPPPQLEWLFAREPMKPLFDARHQFQWGDSRSVDHQLCRNVRVHADGDLYQFWIDERAGVIRRVELPAVEAAPGPGESVQRMSLSLELKDATFDTPRIEPDVSAFPKQPKLVRRFVPLPPPEPPGILGSRGGSFHLTDMSGQVTISDSGGDRQLAVLFCYGGDASSLESVAAMARWNAGMPSTLAERVRVGVLVDPRAASLVPENLGIPIFLDTGRAAAGALQMQSGSLLILDGRGQVVWSQSSLLPAPEDQMRRVGAIIGDLLDGVDVPRRVRQQWGEQVRQYAQMLDRASSEP